MVIMKCVILSAVLLSLALPVAAQQQPTYFVPMLGGGVVALGGGNAPTIMPMQPLSYPTPMPGPHIPSFGGGQPCMPMQPMGAPSSFRTW
jgi:hypothetical protein